MKTERISIPGDGVDIGAYLALPDGEGPWPAIIVIHEIWGLVPHIEDVARRFAGAGYAALAPDVYSRSGTPEGFGDIGRALAWVQARDRGRDVADLRAVLDWLAARPFVDAKRLFSLGFCMGGGLSGRLASSGAGLAGCVIFYGENPPAEEIGNIRCPVLGLYGAEDHRITDGVPNLARAMAATGKRFDHNVYEAAAHAFFNDTRETYRPEAAADAWKRVLRFMDEASSTGLDASAG
jgi:carboxymethylenebutenolidase